MVWLADKVTEPSVRGSSRDFAPPLAGASTLAPTLRVSSQPLGHCTALAGCLQGRNAALAQQPLNTLDGVAVGIEEVFDVSEKVDVLRPIVTSPTASLQRADLMELRLPETQDMLGNIQIVGNLADRAKGSL